VDARERGLVSLHIWFCVGSGGALIPECTVSVGLTVPMVSYCMMITYVFTSVASLRSGFDYKIPCLKSCNEGDVGDTTILIKHRDGKVKDESTECPRSVSPHTGYSCLNRLVKTHGELGKSKAFLGPRSERSSMTIRTMHQGGTGPELAVKSNRQRTETTDVRDRVNGDSQKGRGCQDKR
jgi:hypothetical protein